MLKNIWHEYKKMKDAFPVGCEVILRLEPIEEYFELIWAADSQGTVSGYNIHKTLVVVAFDNGTTMHCGAARLEKAANLTDGFDL